MRGGTTEAEALEKIKMVDMKNFDLIDQTKKYADKVITECYDEPLNHNGSV